MRISVYITSYNQKEYLKEAIDSVLAQTLKPFEILIVDDASTDGSRELLESYSNKHSIIRYECHQENRGVSQVRKTALEQVKGDFVTYVDGDDLYLPNKLEIESRLIREQNSTVAFSNNMYVDADNPNNVNWIWASNKINMDGSIFIKTLTRQFPRNSLFRMELMSTELLKKVGSHDSNLSIYEDYDFRIRLAKYGTFSYSLEPTAKIRISEHGLSKSPLSEHYKAFEYIFNKYKEDVLELPENQRISIQKKIDQMLQEYKPDSSDSTSLFGKIKRKFRS